MVAGLYRLFAIALLRVAVIGDAGNGTDQIAQGIAAVAPVDAIIMTGDNFYPCGVRSSEDPKWSIMKPLAALGVPIYPVLGNHDHCGNAGAQIAIDIPRPAERGEGGRRPGEGPPFANWRFPSREYMVNTGVATFLMIDTTPYAERGAAPPVIDRFTTDTWRIVAGHHPLLSSGYHGYFPRAEHRRMLQLVPAMRAAKVDLYLCGHDHHLELLDANPRMLVSGAASNPIPALMRRGATRWVSQAPFRGFALLELTAKAMTIRFYDEKGVARSEAFTYSR